MDIFEEYATDEVAEVEGVWQTWGKGTRAKLARMGNKNYARVLAKEIGANELALKAEDEAADQLSDKIMATVLAKTIFLDCEGFKYKKEAINGSVEADRVKLLMHKDFRKDVMERSAKREKFAAKYEESQGNA